MKKETLLEIIIGTVGGLIFSIGMCMCLIKEWDMLIPGVVVSMVGFIVLLFIIPVYRKSHPRVSKEKKDIDYGLMLTWVIGIVGSLVMGFGMSKIMVGDASKADMLLGLVTGTFGLLVCVLNYPIYSYIKGNK